MDARPNAITAVEPILLAAPLKLEEISNPAIRTGNGNKFAVLVRVRTADGVTGECYMTVLGVNAADIVHLIDAELAPLIQGMDASKVEACWAAMHKRTVHSMWNRPLLLRAIACIDGALWDCLGKKAGLPLYTLWGGFRERMPVVLMDSRWSPEESNDSFSGRMERLGKSGLGGCKLKVGVHSPYGPVADAARMRLARQAVGPDFRLYADANQGWTTAEAMTFAKHCEDIDLMWLEEPCRWHDDRLGMARLRATGLVPIAAGQMESTAEACRDMMTGGSIDVCNFDASFGGVTAWRKVAALAECFGIAMVQHMEPHLGAQLMAALPHGCHVEVYDRAADPFYYQMISNREEFDAGWIQVSESPGWGLVLDESFISRYRIN